MTEVLTQLKYSERGADSVFAYERGEPITWGQWSRQVQAVRTQLEKLPEGFFPVYFKDSYPASVAVFALWSCGRIPVMLPDVSPYTLEGLDAELQIGGHLTEEALDLPNFIDVASAQGDETAEELALDCRVVMQTSGTTGKPVRAQKTHSQLISECALYAEMWHEESNAELFAATVSHQHIYGLLFKVLLPIIAHRPFVSELLNNPREMLGRYGQSDLVWVASPAQLKRTNAEIMADLPVEKVARIYSSGGLLEPAPAAEVRKIFSNPAFEIYGSTETGGMGWRQQWDREENPWQLFAPVTGRESDEGLLEVSSVFTEDEWITTGDNVDFIGDGQFLLKGRADRIVKLEEKRVSLTALENTLLTVEVVAEARVFLLDGVRQQLAAVVVLSEAGFELLLHQGRRGLVSELRERLGAVHPAHEVPRRYRFVHELPQNSQGKTTLVALSQEFAQSQRETLPVVRSVQVNQELQGQDAELELKLLVPPDLDYFPGHFSHYPVLPGVVQLLWVRHFARLHLGLSGDSQKMSQVKFKSMIHPGEEIIMRLTWRAEKNQLSYKITRDDVCASGIMWMNP